MSDLNYWDAGDDLTRGRVSPWLLLSGVFVAALLCLILLSPNRFVYDEKFFIQYVVLLHKYGPSREFLLSLPAGPGPLIALVQFAAEPLTHLQPIAMRMVNFVLFLAVVLIVWATPVSRQGSALPLVAVSALTVPMTWVISGLALSEIPAMVFVAGSTLFLFRAIDPRASSQSSLWRPLIVSSILLGSASWGRQPYALLCAVPFLIVLQDRKYLVPALVYTSVVTTFLLPLLLIWQGLVPPSMQRTFQGLSFQHLVLSLGYGAVCFFLLAPRFFIERVAWPHFLFLVATVVINLQWRLVFIAPMDTAAQRVIPHDLFAHYATFCGGLLIGVGVIFAGYVTSALWEERHSSHRLIAYSGLLICCVSPVFVAGQYSSRYTAMALPYLLLAAGPWRFQRSVELLLTWLGAVAGALSLYSYAQS